MSSHDHLGFKIRASQTTGTILVPKYYNPEISARLQSLSSTHDLVSISALRDQGVLLFSTGDEIGKMAYGTGPISFVRTSDISNWEIITDPKQGVSQTIYQQYRRKQDVRVGDIFLVRDGTYLIGNCCLVTSADTKVLYQSHILKIRIAKPGTLSPGLLLALLSSPIVRRQIKAKQFTADIIDTLGNRYLELVLPIPRDIKQAEQIAHTVSEITQQRLLLRERIRKIPLWIEGAISSLDSSLPDEIEEETEQSGLLAFRLRTDGVHNNTFVPRYYNPKIADRLKILSNSHDLVTIAELNDRGIISRHYHDLFGQREVGPRPEAQPEIV